MKRRLSRGLLVILLAAITLFFPLLAAPHRIDQAHRELIRAGMTAADVEAIFGAPAGEYDWATRDNRHELIDLILLEAYLAQEHHRLNAIELDLSRTETALVSLRIAELGERRDPRIWTSRHGSVTIWFDNAGRVTSVGTWQARASSRHGNGGGGRW